MVPKGTAGERRVASVGWQECRTRVAETEARTAISASPKEHVNIRLDADVMSAFRSTGSGWQTRLNNVPRNWLRIHA